MRLLLPLLFITGFSFGQETYVPDDNFEAYLEANGMGNGIPNDDYITTANISGVTSLFVDGNNISDMTGIEGFISLTNLGCTSNSLINLDLSSNIGLTHLQCQNNQLTSLDLSDNVNLEMLLCFSNSLTSLDLSNNANLIEINCRDNQIAALDLSNNTLLQWLDCYSNQIAFLDLTANTELINVQCNSNQLSCVNIKNGFNTNLLTFNTTLNPNLTCIEVDDVAWSTANWTNIDPQTLFSTYCNNACSVGISELNSNQPKELIKIVNLLGQEVEYTTNTILIYQYADGTSEKVFTIED